VTVPIVTGLFSVIVSIAGVIGAYIVAGRTARETVQSEYKKRQFELAFKISNLVSENPQSARRFAIGIIKVMKDADAGKRPDSSGDQIDGVQRQFV
jgi:hypothetical protein